MPVSSGVLIKTGTATSKTGNLEQKSAIPDNKSYQERHKGGSAIIAAEWLFLSLHSLIPARLIPTTICI